MKRFFWLFLIPMLAALAIFVAYAPGGWRLLLARWGAARDSESVASLKYTEDQIMQGWRDAA